MKKKVIARLFSYMRPHSCLLVFGLIFALIFSLCSLLTPFLIGKAIDASGITVGAVDFKILIRYLLIIGGLTILACISGLAQQLLFNRLAFLVVRDLRLLMAKKLHTLPISYFDNNVSGKIVGNMVTDAENLSDGLIMGVSQLFSGVITILGILVMMFIANPLVAGVVFVLTPLSLFTAKIISSKTHDSFTKTANLRAEQTSFAEEIILNHKTIKAYGVENNFSEKFREKNESLRQSALKSTFYSSLTNPVTRFVNSVVYFAVALVGGLSVVGKIPFLASITAGTLVSLLSYAGQYAKPFNEISGVITELQSALVGAKRIFDMLDEKEESPDGNSDLNARGNVMFKNVSFSYVPSVRVIDNVSASASYGQHIAIVGKTGCGKTTLINLLMRFYDIDSGKIEFDGTDISNLKRKNLRDNFGMVLQESWIRNATVMDNITLGCPFDKEEVYKVAKICRSDRFITKLENGYDTFLTEDSLSQGEKQLLCITRVMLFNPTMLILDEATSAVDLQTEVFITNAFAELMKGKTSFIVAHRLSTIKNADIIWVMDKGKIVETGSHEELILKNGLYASMYKTNTAGQSS